MVICTIPIPWVIDATTGIASSNRLAAMSAMHAVRVSSSCMIELSKSFLSWLYDRIGEEPNGPPAHVPVVIDAIAVGVRVVCIREIAVFHDIAAHSLAFVVQGISPS